MLAHGGAFVYNCLQASGVDLEVDDLMAGPLAVSVEDALPLNPDGDLRFECRPMALGG